MRERDREALRNGELSPTDLDDPSEVLDEYDALRVENDRLAEALASAEAELLDAYDELAVLRGQAP